MSGCYGNNPEDRHFEALLRQWQEEPCSEEPEGEPRDLDREREESGYDSEKVW